MALKADRNELDVDISFFYNEGTASRGGVTVIDTVGSGAAMDQAGAKVKYAVATNALVPVGILLNDVVNLDLTRQHINWHKDEVQKGGKVSLLKKGWIVTNLVDSAAPLHGTTVTAGQIAYASSGTAGYISNQYTHAHAKPNKLAVGRFLSTVDDEGYYKVEINLPNSNTN
jgi:hypothetical protein